MDFRRENLNEFGTVYLISIQTNIVESYEIFVRALKILCIISSEGQKMVYFVPMGSNKSIIVYKLHLLDNQKRKVFELAEIIRILTGSVSRDLTREAHNSSVESFTHNLNKLSTFFRPASQVCLPQRDNREFDPHCWWQFTLYDYRQSRDQEDNGQCYAVQCKSYENAMCDDGSQSGVIT